MKTSTMIAIGCTVASTVLFGDVLYGVTQGNPINSPGSLPEIFFAGCFMIYPVTRLISFVSDMFGGVSLPGTIFDDDPSRRDDRFLQEQIDAGILLVDSPTITDEQRTQLGDILKHLVLAKQERESAPNLEVKPNA